MNTIGIVFEAEFLRRIRSRAFLFGTAIGAVAIIAIALLPSFLNTSASQTKRIALAGDPSLTTAASALLKRDFTITATLTRLAAVPDVAFLNAHGKAGAVAVLERRGTKLAVSVYTREPGEIRNALATDLAPLQIALATGISVHEIASNNAVQIDEHDLGGRFSDATQAIAAKGIGYLFVMILYLAILLNAQSIVASVTEEKTSRIAELLVSAIDPAKLLFAKVLAASASGFVQLAIWIGAAVLSGNAIGGLFDGPSAHLTQSAHASPVSGVTVADVLWFIVFFALGFGQCGVLFAAAGALVSRSEDVGNVTGPLYIPVVGAIAIAQFAIQFPNAGYVVAFSFVPLISPFVMFTRITVGTVPAWQIVLAIAINLAACIAFAWLGGRVYRIGLLLYGRAPTARQVVAAFRQR